MEINICDIKSAVGKKVTIRGWLFNKRSSGKIHFYIVRDGTGFVQVIAEKKSLPSNLFDLYDELKQESTIQITGEAREDKRSPFGYEIVLEDISLLFQTQDYPIAKKEHGVDFLLPQRHLWLRSRKQWAVMRIRHTVIQAIRDFFDSRDFTLIDAPILTPSSCEGTTTLFETDYFGEKAYLSQSGQLYMEAACFAFKKVYCFGPTFRAEKSKTRRHLMEFWMIEPEVAFATLDDVMKLAEDFVSYIVSRSLEGRKEELKVLERDIKPLENIIPPFPRISYDEAVKIVQKTHTDFKWGDDFGAPHETTLSREFEKPVIIHRYPAKIKSFYMKRDPENDELALCMDIIAPEGFGEIIGGSEREDNLKTLLKRLKEYNLPVQDYEWFLDLRRYGSCPHSGFGLGLERTIAWICGVRHLRETIPFPRLLEKIYP